MKRIISGFLTLSLLICSYSFLNIETFAKDDSRFVTVDKDFGSVSFDCGYAKPGVPVKVLVSDCGSEKLFYKWYLDNEQIPDNTDTYTPDEYDYEKMLTVKVFDSELNLIGEKSMLISTLPVIYFEVENRNNITSKKTYYDSDVTIQGNDEFNDSALLYTGKAGIRGRGNATWHADKKPYKVKLDSKANLFGMGKNKHWVLLSNPYDPSNLRNKLAYDLSENIGLPGQQSVFVDLVINGKVVGIYLLCEHVRIGSNRVDITNWEDIAEDTASEIYKKNKDIFTDKKDKDNLIDAMTEDLSWTTSDTFTFKGYTFTISDYCEIPDINGGYLFSIDSDDTALRFRTNQNRSVVIDTPEGISTDMRSFLEDYCNAFEDALYSDDYCTVYNGKTMRYTDFIDVDSFARGILINEIFENADFGFKSVWMSMDIGGKIVYGPVWDMDYSTTYVYNKWSSCRSEWLKLMISDPVMLNAIRNVYWQYRHTAITDMMKSGGSFDTEYQKINIAANHSDSLWMPDITFENDAADLRWRLQLKISWLDDVLFSLDSAIDSVVSGSVKQEFIKSESLNLSVNDSVLSISCSNSPDRINIYSDGVLLNEINNPSETETADISEADVVTVLAYDADNNAIAGNFISTEKYISSLKVTSLPEKDEYIAGESLDLTGLTITAVYSDGTERSVDYDTVYTYAEDTIGSQTFCYGTVTDKIGSVYAVIMCGNAKTEIPLKIAGRENFEEVIEMIENLPENYDNQSNFIYLFEALDAYEALSEDAKAKVENYEKLNKAMSDFDNKAGNDAGAALGICAQRFIRYDARNTMVVALKGSADRIMFVNSDNGTATFSKPDPNIYSIKTIGEYELWTLGLTIYNANPYNDWHAIYIDSSTYNRTKYTGERIVFSDLNDTVQGISRVIYENKAQLNEEFSIKAYKSDLVSSVEITDNGNAVNADEKISDGYSEYTFRFTEPGEHTVKLSYLINGAIHDSRIIKVFAADETDNSTVKYYGSSCIEDYRQYSDASVVTDFGVSEVKLVNSSETIELTPSCDSDKGFITWTGKVGKDKEYAVYIDGVCMDDTVYSRLIGDINIDGLINSNDALKVLQKSVEKITMTDDQLIRADINKDGFVNSADALFILQVSTGKK